MGSLFDSILKENESLFQNELALNYEFVPKLVPYREAQQKRVAACIAPMFNHHTGRNIVVYGPPGVGKTVATKHIINELQEKTDEIVPFYINCWHKNTSFKVILELCEQIDYKFTHNKKTDELFDIVAARINKLASVFIFDEIDKAEDTDFLYLILSKIQNKSIILLTNYKDFVANIDMRIRSRLLPEMLEFKPYDKSETKGILQQRVELAFLPKIWSVKAFDMVVERTHELADIRSGLYLLKESGLCAEEKSSKIIDDSHVVLALAKLDEFKIKSSTELADDTQQILELIKKRSPAKIGDLYSFYQKDLKGLASYKTFTRRISKLEEGKFIVVEKTEGGPQGNTSIISYNTSGQNKKLDEF
ncbi:MAG TPA: AAA family ATPase [Acidobacteriota bacterium]|nr:AAA family ATPase [Acidobacteriota bacterium]